MNVNATVRWLSYNVAVEAWSIEMAGGVGRYIKNVTLMVALYARMAVRAMSKVVGLRFSMVVSRSVEKEALSYAQTDPLVNF